MSKKKKAKRPSLAKKPQSKPAAKPKASAPAKPKVVRKGSEAAQAATTRSRSKAKAADRPLTFGRDTYLWMSIGSGLILLGMILMSGGQMPNPEEWDPNIIYAFRRITLAPIVILGGVATVIYAILKK